MKLALTDVTANTVCVESNFQSTALQICLIITALCRPLLLKFDSFRFPSKTYHSFGVVFCHLVSFKVVLVSAFYSSFFFSPPKTDFSGTTLMRPSHRFHGDSHKTVKFPLFQKSCGGCSATVRRISKRRVASFKR